MWLWKILGDVTSMHTTCCKEKIRFQQNLNGRTMKLQKYKWSSKIGIMGM